MRRRRPRGQAYVPLPRLEPGLTRGEWYGAMRLEWCEAFESGSERWAAAHALLDEAEAFEYPAGDVTAMIRQLDNTWKAAS